MHTRPHHTSRRAFTLLEILLVLAILGVLATVAAVNLIGTSDRAMVRATATQLNTFKGLLQQYRLDKGGFPTTAEGLQVLVPTYIDKIPGDGWNSPFNYISPTQDPNRPFDIRSAGPDREWGTADDMTVWDL